MIGMMTGMMIDDDWNNDRHDEDFEWPARLPITVASLRRHQAYM